MLQNKESELKTVFTHLPLRVNPEATTEAPSVPVLFHLCPIHFGTSYHKENPSWFRKK